MSGPDTSDEADSHPLPPTRKGPSRAVSVSFTSIFLFAGAHLPESDQTKLGEWLPWRWKFLEELLRLEAIGGCPLQCTECQSLALFRCTNCFGWDLLCKTCILAAHMRHPFHRVEVRPRRVTPITFTDFPCIEMEWAVLREKVAW